MRSVAVQKPPQSDSAALPETLNEAFSQLFRPMSVEATELVLVRHAEPDYRAAGRNGDPLDPPLTEKGRWQAMRLAMRLRRMEIDAIYTSTMRRALETAVFVAAAKDMPMIRMPQLREVQFDAHALKGPAGDVERLAAELAIRFLNNPRWDSLPGFEPSRQFRHRVIQAIDGILAHHHCQRVAVVTHAGVINAYLSMLLDVPRDMFFLPGHASISVVRSLPDLTSVECLNDFAHLLPMFNPH